MECSTDINAFHLPIFFPFNLVCKPEIRCNALKVQAVPLLKYKSAKQNLDLQQSLIGRFEWILSKIQMRIE